MLKNLFNILIIVLLLISFSFVIEAGNTATQNINITVSTINEISLSNNEVNLMVNAPSSGSNLDKVSDSSTTISYSTNESNQKITAHLDEAMAPGLTLMVEVNSTAGNSMGQVMLEDEAAGAVDVVKDISNVSESGETVIYTLIPDMYAQPMTKSYIVTYTITSDL